MNPITKLYEDINNRIAEEYERIKKTANPREEVNEYVWNIQWYSPGLAAHVKRQMLFALDLHN